MKEHIIPVAIWLFGFGLSYLMILVEHQSENKVYTKGDRALNFVLSLFSFLMVAILLIKSWIAMIARTGYWNKPAGKK